MINLGALFVMRELNENCKRAICINCWQSIKITKLRSLICVELGHSIEKKY